MGIYEKLDGIFDYLVQSGASVGSTQNSVGDISR
jgi:hypothetical protein